jgi:hypothetical protein
MGRKKRWPVRVHAKFAPGTLERIAAVLYDGKERTAFIREAVEREIARRIGTKEKLATHPRAAKKRWP